MIGSTRTMWSTRAKHLRTMRLALPVLIVAIGANLVAADQTVAGRDGPPAIPIIDTSSFRYVDRPWTTWFPRWFPNFLYDKLSGKLGIQVRIADLGMQTNAHFSPGTGTLCAGHGDPSPAGAARCATLCVRLPVGARILRIQGFAEDPSLRPSPAGVPCDGERCLGKPVAQAQASFDPSGPTQTLRATDLQVCWGFREESQNRRLDVFLIAAYEVPKR